MSTSILKFLLVVFSQCSLLPSCISEIFGITHCDKRGEGDTLYLETQVVRDGSHGGGRRK
ncbi:hypothetical protein ACI2KS_10560 [Pseudomonas sp. NPDC087358]|uniref:hypothetical protein n=1 Tax=Pseudomonas sp. NPDC087358 TaxID=3364439 RepID=UPI00384C8639